MEQIPVIFLDTSIFLGFFLKDEEWREYKKILQSKSHKVINTIVLMEIKYNGIKKFGLDKTREILFSIESDESVTIVPIVKEIAEYAADLRIKYYDKKRQISFADTINLATAILTRCEIFYSSDKDFEKIEEIRTEIV